MKSSPSLPFPRWFAVVLLIAIGALYLWTVPPHYVGGDHGLFAIIAAEGGYAHPPGYPLFSMYIHAMSWLPSASPAHAASLATALLGIASLMVLFRACRSWGASALASLLAVAAFGVARHVWLIHTQSEVFALNHLFAALILWISSPDGPLHGTKRLASLGLVAGLALTHHHSIILLAPIGLYGLSRGWAESERPGFGILASVVLGLTGLLPYAYLAIVSRYFPEMFHWGDASSFRELLGIFLRRNYGTLQLTIGDTQTTVLTQIKFLAESVLDDFMYLPALLGLAGFLLPLVRRERPQPYGWKGWAAIVMTLLLTGPLFVSLFNRHPQGVDFLLIRKFHLLFECLFTLVLALGISRLWPGEPKPWSSGLIACALILLGALRALPYLDVHQAETTETYVADTLRAVAPRAILLGTGDHHFIGTTYLQRAQGLRQDVQYIDASLLATRWYHRLISQQLGAPFAYTGRDIDTSRLLDDLLATGRPVYITHAFHLGLLGRHPSSPHGTVIRVYASPDSMPSLVEVLKINATLYDEFRVVPTPLTPPTSWGRLVLERYADTWWILSDALARQGQHNRAQQARDLAAVYAPWRDSQNHGSSRINRSAP